LKRLAHKPDITQIEVPEGAKKAAMPGMVKPMLAKLIDKPFDDEGWLFEIKWDGYRALANLDKGNVLLYSRNGIVFDKYTEVSDALTKFPFDAILDGEVVALDTDGIPKFQYLQNFETDPSHPLQYQVFDILYYNGYDLKAVGLAQRKAFLQKILPKNEVVRYSDHVMGTGIDFFNLVAKMGLEGIVGKKADSTYQVNKRTGAWVKIKTGKRQEAIICGYTEPKGSRQYFGSLILGVYEKNALKWIGSSGGGFDEESLETIYKKLIKLKQEASPFGYKITQKSKIYWVAPKLICEVSFSEWTDNGSMRHPVFLGLRPDKNPKDVKREKETNTNQIVK